MRSTHYYGARLNGQTARFDSNIFSIDLCYCDRKISKIITQNFVISISKMKTYLPLSEHVIFPNHHYLLVCVNERFLSAISKLRVEDVAVCLSKMPFLHKLKKFAFIKAKCFFFIYLQNLVSKCLKWVVRPNQAI
jgi:hypothetical protein